MRLLSALTFDVRHAIRSLVGTPGVTLTAVAVLTLGIGASAAIFSVVDGIVLRGLPYPDEDNIVVVNETDIGTGVQAGQRASLGYETGRPVLAAYQNYLEWVSQQDVFEAIAASANGPVLTTADPERQDRDGGQGHPRCTDQRSNRVANVERQR